MNENIQKLVIEAGFPEWSNKTIGFELEKFAELIINECSGIVLKNTNTHTYHRVSYEIKQHFGVK
jgi:hypothetical protein